MKVFVDANILVSVLNKEYPLFSFTSRILSLGSAGKRFKLVTSPLCLAIAFYFAEKKNKMSAAKKIALLCDHLEIAGNSAEGVQKTILNPQIRDFEDGLEYYAAVESKCGCILTEDLSDFHFSEIDVLNSVSFCGKYLI